MRKVVFAATIAASMALPAVALAQMSAPSLSSAYIGGGIGQSKAKDGCTGVGGAGISCDDKDTAWKILGGYQVNRNFAAELGYTDLGKVKASGPGGSAEIKSNAWDLTAIGAFPLANQFSIFGRLGFYRAETKLSGAGSGKKDTTDLTYGLGVQYDFARNFGVRGEWQRYRAIKARNDATGIEGKSDVDVLGVSLIYRFQ
ncbi:MAG TPA: outer membrane beta-barrel protein [Burkholderiales bacterium]|nr:outer membrane beta-barrel protein [Burkholderiales bacterium]